MSRAETSTTLSTKGQIILPAEVRRRRGWGAGTRLVIEETPDGVLLKPAPLFERTRPEEVFGMLPCQGQAKSIEEIARGH